MAGSEKVYGWDSNLFLAWLRDEKTHQSGDMAGVRDLLRKLQKREIKLVVSVLVYTEVLTGKIPAGLERQFHETLLKRNVQRVSVDSKIAKLAADLRKYYFDKKKEFGGKTLSVGDSLHLATAIIYQVDEFHTFDKDGGKDTIGLLPLSGNVAGHPLKISKPQADNPELELV